MLSNTFLKMKTNAQNTSLYYARRIGIIWLIGILFLSPQTLSSQIVWQETFNTYANATQQTANWTTNFNDCDGTNGMVVGDFWGVFNGEFRINDIEGFNCLGLAPNSWGDLQNTLTTTSINISAHECVRLSVDIRKTGDLDCVEAAPISTTPASNNGHDQVVVEYRVDAGGWTQFATDGYICGEDNLPTTASQTQVTGNTVQIRITVGNVAGSENYYLDDITVEVDEITPTLSSFGPFCNSDPSTPLPTVQNGISGSWSGPGVLGGVSFNPSTASVGSNTLTFTPNPGQCANTNTTSITVNSGPNVDDIPNQTACGSYTLPVITGSNLSGSAAYYTAPSGTGVQLNPGQSITAATTTTLYIFDNNGGCTDEEQFNVTIIPRPDIDDLADVTACGSYTLPAITGTNLNGNEAYFTATARGGTQYNPGQVINSTVSLYIHGGAGGCDDEEQVLITITPAPNVDDQANTSACGSYTLPPITGSNLTGNEAYFTQSGGGGTQFNPGQTINSTITLFIYDTAGSCDDEESVTITITAPPNIDVLPNQTACGSYTLPAITGTNLTGNEAYYTSSNGAGTQFNPGQNITSNITLFIYGGTGSCSDEETVNITITPAPDVDDQANISACGSYSLPVITGSNLTGGEAYYSQTNGGGTSFAPGQTITSTTTLFIYDGSGACSDEESVTITITSPPDIDDIPNQTACGTYTLPNITGTNLTGNEAYYTGSGGSGNRFNPGQTISANTTLFIYGGTGTCTDEEQFTITFTTPPNVLDLPNQTACGSYTLPAINGTNLTGNQAYYTGPNGTGTRFNPGQAVTSTTSLFIYDGVDPCDDQEQFTITITAGPDINDIPTQNVCGTYTLPAITGTNLTGNEAFFTASGGNGTRFEPGDLITNSITLFIYGGTTNCNDEELFSINVSPQPQIDDIGDPTACGSYTLPPITGTNLSGSEAYYTNSGGLGTSFAPGELITSSTTLFIYDGAPGCNDQVQVDITINPPIEINDIADQNVCNSYTLPNITGTNLTGNEAYFTQAGGQGTQLNPGEIITTSTTLFIYDGVPGCEDEEQVIITITPQPDIDDLADPTACASFTLPNITGTNLTGNEAYFTQAGGQGTQLNPGEIITTSTTLFIYDGVPGCEDEEQVIITITPQPDIDDLAAPTACASYTLPNITGTNLTGNEAYFTQAGGQGTQLNPGEIITTSTTLFIYDGVPGCEDEEQVIITITPQPDIDDLAAPTACASYTLPNITGTNLTGNEAYFTQAGGQGTQLNPGEIITTSTTLFIYDGVPGCEDEEQVIITITPQPDIDDLADPTVCASFTLPNITGTNLTGNEAYFTQASGQGTQLNPGEIITTTTTLFIYDGVPGCEEEEQIIITITPQPDIDDLADPTACASFTLPNITGTNLTGNEAYFTQAGGQGTQLNPGEIITTSTTLFIYDGVPGCEDEEQVIITITPQPDIDDLADPTACASFTLPNITGTNLTGNEAYFTQAGGQGTQLNPGEIITTTTTLFIYDGVPGCEDEEQVIITITPQPDIDDLADPTVCASFTLPNITGTNLTGNEAYFTQAGGQGTQLNPGEIITTSTTLFIYDGVPGCEDEEQVIITITPQPDIDDLADPTACASFTLPNITGTNLTGNEAYFTQASGQGTQLNPGEIITTTTTLFIYDGVPGCEDEEQVIITITPQPDIDDLADPTACASFTLPNITGTNLTGNEAYFTQAGGQGTQLNPGEIITTTTTLFIYDGVPGCEDEEQVIITITPQPDIDDLAAPTACASFTLPNITGTNLTGNEAYFTQAGGQGTQLNPGEIITTTTTLFIYDGVPGCEDEEQVIITITPQPDIDDLAAPTACASFTLPNITGTNLTGNEAYFTQAGGQGTQLNPGEIITTSTTLFIYDGVPGCEDEEQIIITITPQPDIDDLADPTACASYTLPNITGTNLTGNEAYFTQAGGQGTQLNPGEIITTTTTLFIYDGVPGCEDEEQVIITITPQPDIDDLADPTACASFTLPNITGTNLTGNEAYFTQAGGQGTQLNPGEIITTSTTLFIYDGVPGCEDEEQIIITITPQPDIDDLADPTACASYTLPNITGTNLTGNEAYFTQAGGQGTQLNPGEIITTSTTLFIYDGVPGCEDEEQIIITITPQPDIDDLADPTACASYTLPNITGTNLTGNEAYFTQAGGQGTQLNPGEIITTTTTLFIYDGVPGCEDEEEFTVAIAGQPRIDPIDDVSVCGGYTLPEINGTALSGNQSYFTEPNGMGIRFTPGEIITASTTLFAFDGAVGCEDEFSFTITILEGPDISPLDEQFACSNFQLPAIEGNNLTGNEAYYTGPAGTGTRFEVGDIISTSQTLFMYDGTAGCEDEEAFSLTIIPEPQIDDIPNQVVCELFVLPIITGVNLSGNEAYFDQSNGNGNRFQAGDVITTDQVLFIWDNSNGCNSQQVFEIIVNEAPEVILTPSQLTCAGASDGQITTSILAGSAPFTYDWNFDQFDGEDTLRDLSAGLYSLVLSDANNCSTTTSVTLAEPTAITLSCAENSPVTTLGGNDGVADIDLMGGAAPFVLSWENGSVTGLENIGQEGVFQLSSLTAGNYTVVVTDNNACDASCTFTITDPACSLSVSTSETNATCHDSNDGAITVDLTGGQGPFTFSWSDPSLDGTQNPSGLAAGDYMLTVVDANGCEVIASTTIVAPPALSLTGLNTRPVSSNGQSDGGISVNYQGGTAPYQISWAGELFGSLTAPSSGVFSLDIFPEGDYTLTLTDNNACQTSIDFTIPGVDCNLSITLQGENLNCFEDQSGRIQLSIVGGVSPLDINWNIDSLDGLRTPQNLAAGDYEVIVTDANGCSALETISLQEPSPLSVVCAPANEASAPGATDGTINVEVSGGAPNYTVDWSNGIISGSENLFIPGTAEIDSLSAGDYEVFVIDDNGCMETCGVEVTEACPTSESTLASTLCAGDSLIINGNIYNAANPSGQEVLSGANALGCDSIVNIDLQFFAEATATIDRELCQGESLTIGNTEFNVDNPSGIAVLPNATLEGCDSVINVNLSFLAAPVFSLEGNTTICPGESATLTFRASNFSDPVNITLSDGVGNLIPVPGLIDGATFEVNPLSTTTYSIMDTDANGSLCQPVIDGAVTIEVADLIVDLSAFDYNGFQLSCADAEDGQIEVIIQGGVEPYTYQWSNGATTETLENLADGAYELTITDANGCEAISEILLSAPNTIELEVSAIPPGCNGETGLIRVESIAGGSGPFSVALDGNTPQTITGFPFEFSSLSPGSYELIIMDANGCLVNSVVVIPNEESLLLDLGADITLGLGETATINAIANFTIDKFIWEPNDSIVPLGNNEFSVSPKHTTVYTFTATDLAGCSVSDQITIIVDRSVDLFQPTAFSPNNDGVNDVFQVLAGSAIMRINSFHVFDRWGNTVYEGYDKAPNDPSLAWDGTYRGQPLNSGVYVYYVEVTFVDGRTEVFKGDVALIR